MVSRGRGGEKTQSESKGLEGVYALEFRWKAEFLRSLNAKIRHWSFIW